jgi:hypothetical protein
MPKGGLAVVAEDDGGGGIEDFHIIVGARVAGTRLNLSVVFQL